MFYHLLTLILIFPRHCCFRIQNGQNIWHIACVFYNSSEACWAMLAVIKKRCITKVIADGNSTPAPAYLGIWNYYKFIKPKVEFFSFIETTLNVVLRVLIANGLTNSLMTKKYLQSRSCGMSNLALTSLV